MHRERFSWSRAPTMRSTASTTTTNINGPPQPLSRTPRLSTTRAPVTTKTRPHHLIPSAPASSPRQLPLSPQVFHPLQLGLSGSLLRGSWQDPHLVPQLEPGYEYERVPVRAVRRVIPARIWYREQGNDRNDGSTLKSHRHLRWRLCSQSDDGHAFAKFGSRKTRVGIFHVFFRHLSISSADSDGICLDFHSVYLRSPQVISSYTYDVLGLAFLYDLILLEAPEATYVVE